MLPADSRLVSGKQFRIVYGTVMVHLPPFSVYHPKNPRRPDRQRDDRTADTEFTQLPAHGVEHLSDLVDGVVVEFDVHMGRAAEDAFIDSPDFVASAFNPAEGVVHCNVLGLRPVLSHLLQIPVIEGIVEVT